MKKPHKPIPLNPSPDELQRFYASIKSGEIDECWPSLRVPHPDGHCYVSFRGIRYFAHRLAYAWYYHLDPGSYLVCHKCDNPRCCNPKHHFLGTNTDNLQDAALKGLMNHGEDRFNAKLSENDVCNIKLALEASELTMEEIGLQYNVSQSTISMIAQGKNWKHVTGGKVARSKTKRSLIGEDHPGAIITAKQAVEIREIYSLGSTAQAELARQYGISRGAISSLLRGENWSSIPVLGRPKRAKTKFRGEKHCNAKLTNLQVDEIRQRALTGENYGNIASDFGISRSTVCQIKTGKRRTG